MNKINRIHHKLSYQVWLKGMIKILIMILLILMKIFNVINAICVHFIESNNIDRSCLNKRKFHLSRRGSSYLANNFEEFVGSLWKSDPVAKVTQRTHKHKKFSLDGLKSLRTHNHRDMIVS